MGQSQSEASQRRTEVLSCSLPSKMLKDSAHRKRCYSEDLSFHSLCNHHSCARQPSKNSAKDMNIAQSTSILQSNGRVQQVIWCLLWNSVMLLWVSREAQQEHQKIDSNPVQGRKRSLKATAPHLQEGVDRAVKQSPRKGESSRHNQTSAGVNTAGKEKGWEK